ncbi:DNA resolvase [Acetobacter nitrogenifigens DSM 23921 = NBRC 105050]|nr:DNA resolvase [Acetobacter nitrogenifigens DSM 23921 = NBRC 105050]
MYHNSKVLYWSIFAVKIGYARVSTTDQDAGLAAQERDLQAAGCEKVFAERISAVKDSRPQLATAVSFLRKGDTLVVTKPDRLARSTGDLLALVDRVRERGAELRILSMGGAELDTSSPTSALMLTMLGAIAQFERDLMLERQKEGIARARTEGRYRGRVPTARAKSDQVQSLAQDGVAITEISRRLGISRSSVYRCLGRNF